MKLKHAVFALAAMFGLAATGAQAQTAYPNRPITVIVPFAAGGPPTPWRALSPNP